MTSTGEQRERVVLERLRERYEGEGYSFYLYPPTGFLPSFLEGYRPDAVAMKEGSGVVIEVKGRTSSQKDMRLSELAGLFSGERNWRLEIVSIETEMDEFPIEPQSRERIERELHSVEALARHGQFRAAFLIAWGVLEAAGRSLRGEARKDALRPMGPREVSEMLARNGFIDQNSAQTLRRLGRLRNAIAHGNLEQEVSQAEVTPLVTMTRGLLDQLQPAA